MGNSKKSPYKQSIHTDKELLAAQAKYLEIEAKEVDRLLKKLANIKKLVRQIKMELRGI